MIKPWRIRESRQTFKDQFLSVRTDSCERADGQIVPTYHVLEFTEWATVVPLTPEGNIVLIREYRHAAQKVTIGLPGGVSDPGETDWESVGRRELLEETGYTAGAFHLIGECYPNPAIQNNKLHFFLALDCRRTHPQTLDPNEEIEVLEIPYTEFLKYETLPVQHALHATGLFYAERWLAQHPDQRPQNTTAQAGIQGGNDDSQAPHARTDDGVCRG